jgi:hypothetical protein
MKNILKIIIFQGIFGFITFLGYLFCYFLLENILDIVIIPVSVVFTILSLLFYKVFLSKLTDIDCKRNILFCLAYFIIISIISSCFALCKIDFFNILSVILQQSYYLVSEISGNKISFTYVFIAFLVENIIKFVILSPLKIFRHNKLCAVDERRD